MAAFTTFSDAALERYLVMFDIGDLHSFEPVPTGIENSNYFVSLTRHDDILEFVLTITEGLDFHEVPFFNELLGQLDRAGLPVPVPVRTLDGMASTIFCGKPAWLFPRLPGSHPSTVNPAQCEIIGNAIARLHQAASTTRYSRVNPYGPDWARQTLELQRHHLSAGDDALLTEISDEYATLANASDLPKGIIHGDLFRDNALFEGETLTGIIDFYHACEDYLIQDVAITINDWCTTASGNLDSARYSALLKGYESVRSLTPMEREQLSAFRRCGAMRFVLTRLLSGNEGGHLKDPEEFLRIARSARYAE